MLLVLWSDVGVRGDGKAGVFVITTATSFDGDPWRRGCAWAVMYRCPSYIFLLDEDEEEGVLDIYLSSTPSQRYASSCGFRLRPLVLLSFLSIFGSCVRGDAAAGAASVRYVYSYLEKLGWSFPAGVTSLLVDLESSAVLGAPDLLRLGDGFTGRSASQACIDFFDVPTAAKVGFKNLDVASSEAFSSSWSSASSRKFAVLFFHGGSDEQRLRLPATWITGEALQELGCNIPSFRDVPVSCQYKLLYQ
ncbi:hypothetical protein C2845_PM02G14820 [Panicum miliaceum]|uniref:Uncharacterized protein n=1 Tax=Panicum miliaceum TaxID=4540 RepID=A0A3L6SBZ7_PANMI|nr:hypothetical protein C2845_PM02G14820 [Panicum miliaceum]